MPEADGGLGLTEVDLVLLLEEAGRAALPEPLVESALLARTFPEGGSASGGRRARPTPRTSPGPRPPTSSSSGLDLYPAPTGVEPQPSVDRARRLVRVGGRDRRPSPSPRLADDPFDRMAFGTAATLSASPATWSR